MKRLAGLLLVCAFAATCGHDSSPAAPSQTPPPQTPTPPAPGTRVLGLFPVLNFGEVTVGQTATLRSTILNSGNSTLTVSNVTLPVGYSTTWRSGTVAPGAKQALDVTFAPTAAQSYDGTMTIVADQTVGVSTAPVTGVGNAPFGGQSSGRIVDMQTVRDILDYNQNAPNSRRHVGYITRWEPPVRVYLDPSIDTDRNRQRVQAAMQEYRTYAGIDMILVGSNSSPRVLIRTGTDGLGGSNDAGAAGGVDDTLSNNQASSGIVVIRPPVDDSCTPTDPDCFGIFYHELGHALGVMGHLPAGVSYEGRYYSLLRTLYSLPHGTKVQEDGTWQVVLH